MQPMPSKSNKSLAILTLLILAIIAGIVYLQISTIGSSAVNNGNKYNNSPTTASTEEQNQALLGESSLMQPTSTKAEQQISSWQPGLSVATDVESVTITTSPTTTFYQYQHLALSNIFSYQYQQTIEHNLDALKFNPYLGIEADYANLSSNHIGQASIANNIAETQYYKNDDAAAVFVNFIGTFDFDQSSALFAKIGINAWQVNDYQLNAMSTSPNNAAYQTNINSDSSIGTDIFYGVGFKYDWHSLIIMTEYQIIELNGKQYKVYSIGGTIRF